MLNCSGRTQWRAGVLLGIAAATLIDFNGRAQAPDPTTLIQGIESSRLQIPPSRLYLHVIFQDQLRKNESDQMMEFEGERRRCVNLAPKSMNAKSMFFDGEQACLYDADRKEVTLRDIADSTPDALFDPRVLGLSVLGWRDRVADVLPYKEGQVEMVGKEPISGVDAWHVRISMNKVQQYTIDLWVGDTEKFPVYRYDLTFGSGKQSILSFYENKNYPWLPSKMEHSCFYTNDTLRYKLTVQLTNAEANVSFSETNWTLAGLNLPAGTEVIDRRSKMSAGFWNGTNLTPYAVWMADRHAKHHPPVPVNRYSEMFVLVLFLGAAVFPFFLWKKAADKKPL